MAQKTRPKTASSEESPAESLIEIVSLLSLVFLHGGRCDNVAPFVSSVRNGRGGFGGEALCQSFKVVFHERSRSAVQLWRLWRATPQSWSLCPVSVRFECLERLDERAAVEMPYAKALVRDCVGRHETRGGRK